MSSSISSYNVGNQLENLWNLRFAETRDAFLTRSLFNNAHGPRVTSHNQDSWQSPRRNAAVAIDSRIYSNGNGGGKGPAKEHVTRIHWSLKFPGFDIGVLRKASRARSDVFVAAL